MAELTYEDYKNRIDIKDLLVDAGYHFNRKEGVRYPVFVRLDSNGYRVHGDKFILTRNGLCCFRPSEQRRFNIISFIKEHPHFFSEYSPGINMDRLVNLVCKRLLGQPVEDRWTEIKEHREEGTFDLRNYELLGYDKSDKENVKRFYPFFRPRGLDLWTQTAFAGNFFIATNIAKQKEYQYYNLAFPFHVPGKEEIVGLEERGVKRKDGNSYKGKAAGTNSVTGMWIANLSGKPLDQAERVYWFESAYDAMAFFQVQRKLGQENRGVYISTAGNPGEKQFSGMLEFLPDAEHHLCFDRDLVGQVYACNFMMQRAGKPFSSYSMPNNGPLVFVDKSQGQEKYEFDKSNFSFSDFCKRLDLHDARTVYHPAAEGYKDWNDQLLEKGIEKVMQEKKQQLLASRINIMDAGKETETDKRGVSQGTVGNGWNGKEENEPDGLKEEPEEEERRSSGFRR